MGLVNEVMSERSWKSCACIARNRPYGGEFWQADVAASLAFRIRCAMKAGPRGKGPMRTKTTSCVPVSTSLACPRDWMGLVNKVMRERELEKLRMYRQEPALRRRVLATRRGPQAWPFAYAAQRRPAHGERDQCERKQLAASPFRPLERTM